MTAYGFEWLTDCNSAYNYLKNTKFKIADENYQFQGRPPAQRIPKTIL